MKIEIKEKKWATVVLLEKILDMEVFGHPTTHLKTEEEIFLNSHSIENNFILDGTDYNIRNDIFKRAIEELEQENFIEVHFLDKQSIFDVIDDPLGFVADQVRKDPNTTIEDLSEEFYHCSLILKNLDGIKQKIEHLRSLGISIKDLKEAFNAVEIPTSNVPPLETKKKALAKNKPKPEIHKNTEEESYYFENGIPDPGYALELFIARKILDKKTRPIFIAKEFSFRQHSYAEICHVINSFIEKGILYLSGNTSPEDLTYSYEECEELFGEDEPCVIKWSAVKRVEKDSKELKWASFDFDVEDEVQLRGIIDIGISEFMNDKRYGELGDLVDLASLSSNELTYEQQRDIVLNDLKEKGGSEVLINISDYPHPKVDIVRTLLSLEKEGALRLKGFSWEYKKNPHSESTDDDNIKDFGDKDEVFANVRLIQPTSAAKKHSQKSNIILKINSKKLILIINKNTGDVQLNRFKNNLNPKSREFEILLKLIASENYTATYKDLLGDNPTSAKKRTLVFTIRNIKGVLGILPAKKAKNKDIIKNMKNYGYRLLM